MKLNLANNRIAASLAAAGFLSGLALTASGAVIYRETFGATVDQSALSTVGWNAVSSAAAAPGNGAAGLSNVAGRPNNLDNVNASTSPSQTNGIVFLNGTNIITEAALVSTSEYTVSRSLYNIDSISFYAGNASTVDVFRVAVQISGNWYVTNQTYSTAAMSGANFGTLAELKTFNFTSAASAWLTLASAAQGSLALGTALTSNLPAGDITSFGLFTDDQAVASSRRFDTFEINATLIPEPSAALLGAVGMIGLFSRRRRSI